MADDKLEELERRLYRPGESFTERKEDFTKALGKKEGEAALGPPSVLQPKVHRAPGETPQKAHSRMRFFLIVAGILLFLAAVAWGLYAAFFRGPVFFRRDVLLTLETPEKVRGGEEFEMRARVENKTPFPLRETELTLVFPEGAVVGGERRLRETKPVGTIEAGRSWEEPVRLRLLGSKDAAKSFTARLTYRPGDISSHFQNTAEAVTTIASAPFIFSLELPKEAFASSGVRYVIRYENTAGVDFPDAMLRVQYPRHFTLQESSPPATGEGEWDLGRLPAGRRGSITLTGAFAPEAQLEEELRAALGVEVEGEFLPYSEVVGVTRIVKPFLELEASVNGRPDYPARLGEALAYSARWLSNASTGLENVVIRAKLASDVFDLTTLKPGAGTFDSRSNEIVWSSREAPELAVVTSKETGVVSFAVNLKEEAEINFGQARELKAEVLWTIETTTVPAELNLTRIAQEVKTVTPISSRVEVLAQGVYKESVAGLANSGPYPPRVNETTTYAIHWRVKAFANALERTELKTLLTPGVEFTGKTAVISGQSSAPTFDARTGDVTWVINRIEPGATHEAVFQVAFIPSLLQKGTQPRLLSETRLNASDAFTGVALTAVAVPITTGSIEIGGVVQ